MTKFSIPTMITGIIMVIQGLSTLILVLGWKQPQIFTIEHEDTIFIITLMTFFILMAIDNIRITLDINITKDNKDV